MTTTYLSKLISSFPPSADIDVFKWLLFVILFISMPPLFAQQAGETVRLQGDIAEDVYAAGGAVDVLANIQGDLVVAGGRVTISEQISSDVIAAGGTITINAKIGDDLRLAGGDVSLSGEVGDDAIMAGGNLTINPAAKIHGRAWMMGGRIDIAGEIDKELKATGGQIVISGKVNGDVLLMGESISILDSAIITGNLVYRSPEQAEIASNAQIHGTVTYEPIEKHAATAAVAAAAAGIGLITLLSLFITGGAIYLMYPHFVRTAITSIRSEPWKTLGLGLAVFAATPVVIVLLFTTVIGWLPALLIGALYLILLLVGYLTGVFYVGDLIFGLSKRDQVTNTRRLLSFAVALIVVILLSLIPLLGSLLCLVIILLGIGTLKLNLYRAYIRQPR